MEAPVGAICSTRYARDSLSVRPAKVWLALASESWGECWRAPEALVRKRPISGERIRISW